MSKISLLQEISCKVGISGNTYVFSKTREDIENICDKIKKSKVSIYFNEKHKVFVIRIKLASQKEKLKEIFK